MSTLRAFDVPFEQTSMRCFEGGKGGAAIVFMHGSGTGAQTMSNFRSVLEPLAKDFHVFAADLIGYGQSGLLKEAPYFDTAMWFRQLAALIRSVPDQKPIVLVGHSLSASFVLRMAAHEKRVIGVIGTAPFGVSYKVRPGARSWTLPETREALRRQTEVTVLDPSAITDEEIERRWTTLCRPGYREYFSAMFPNDRQFYVDATAVPDEELARIECPVLLMHGANDKSFGPEDTTLPLVRKIKRADAVILNRCGHSIALEQPEKFMGLVSLYFGDCASSRDR